MPRQTSTRRTKSRRHRSKSRTPARRRHPHVYVKASQLSRLRINPRSSTRLRSNQRKSRRSRSQKTKRRTFSNTTVTRKKRSRSTVRRPPSFRLTATTSFRGGLSPTAKKAVTGTAVAATFVGAAQHLYQRQRQQRQHKATVCLETAYTDAWTNGFLSLMPLYVRLSMLIKTVPRYETRVCEYCEQVLKNYYTNISSGEIIEINSQKTSLTPSILSVPVVVRTINDDGLSSLDHFAQISTRPAAITQDLKEAIKYELNWWNDSREWNGDFEHDLLQTKWNLDEARALIRKIGIQLLKGKLTRSVDAPNADADLSLHETSQKVAPERTEPAQYALIAELKEAIKTTIGELNDVSQLTTPIEIHNFHLLIYKILVVCDTSTETQQRALNLYNTSASPPSRSDKPNINKISDMYKQPQH